ncbi:MAG TPA: PilZ domain-containing protein [Terriglobia bacterium]|nr:PilZ domain-containing protein [Terriglobia bacterium]
MQPNIPVNPRRWERALAAIPIRLVLKAENFKADDSATTVDVSLRGAKVQTRLALVPGEWVGLVPKGEFPHAIPARVVWVKEDESNQGTLAGLEFI